MQGIQPGLWGEPLRSLETLDLGCAAMATLYNTSEYRRSNIQSWLNFATGPLHIYVSPHVLTRQRFKNTCRYVAGVLRAARDVRCLELPGRMVELAQDIDCLDLLWNKVEQHPRPDDQEFKSLMSSMRNVQVLQVTARPRRNVYQRLSISTFTRGIRVFLKFVPVYCPQLECFFLEMLDERYERMNPEPVYRDVCLTLNAIWELETAMPGLDVSTVAQMQKWINIAHYELGGRTALGGIV